MTTSKILRIFRKAYPDKEPVTVVNYDLRTYLIFCFDLSNVYNNSFYVDKLTGKCGPYTVNCANIKRVSRASQKRTIYRAYPDN